MGNHGRRPRVSRLRSGSMFEYHLQCKVDVLEAIYDLLSACCHPLTLAIPPPPSNSGYHAFNIECGQQPGGESEHS